MTQHSLETKEISYFDNLSVRFGMYNCYEFRGFYDM